MKNLQNQRLERRFGVKNGARDWTRTSMNRGGFIVGCAAKTIESCTGRVLEIPMVYVFKTISYPVFIKVGYSENSPDERIKSVQTGCPYKIEIHMIKSGNFAAENMIQAHLKEFRTHGEWFIFSPECEKKLNEFFGILPLRSIRKESLQSRRTQRRIPNPELSEKILELVSQGKTIRKIAEIMGVHKDTVMRYKNLYPQRTKVAQSSLSPTLTQ
jgi:hypothetical protein